MGVIEVKVPNIGDFENVPVIEINVKPGDAVKPDDPLITLESEKAAMEVPAPRAGKVSEVLVHIGDKVSEGSAILKLTVDDAAGAGAAPPKSSVSGEAHSAQRQQEMRPTAETEPGDGDRSASVHRQGATPNARGKSGDVYAGPSVRRIARELDVDLSQIRGTGTKGRITKEDVKAHMARGAGGGSGIPDIPAQDFSKYGPVEAKPMSRLQRLSGPNLHRSWLNVPLVTNSDEADITDLEAYRKSLDEDARKDGYRVTLVSFLIKASVTALKAYPEVNSSLSPGKDALILKRYYNIGVAVDTPDGLVVPVIKDADRKGVLELSRELGEVSARMRAGKIMPADIQGASFSISSLGGIGGTGFTPIVNAPEVAILGAMRAEMRPRWDGARFEPRLMLPLCLSYDHRAVDGALAARFLRKLCDGLADVRQLVL